MGTTPASKNAGTSPPLESATLGAVLLVEEVAEILRVDRKSAYRLVADGKIPGVQRVGRAIRICRSTFLAWLAGGNGDAA